MSDKPRRTDHGPHADVQVEFLNTDYRTICERYGGGFELLPFWQALGDMLHGRPGWHFSIDPGRDGAAWHIGLLGESRLLVDVTENGEYHCYDHDRDAYPDADTVVPDLAGVEHWLGSREKEARKPSPTLLALARTFSTDSDWVILKRHPFRLRASWSDGSFAVSLPHHLDVAFGATLPEALHAAAEMLCRLFEAPLELATELHPVLELDETAARRVLE